MSDSEEGSLGAKAIAAGVLLLLYGVYHHFATNNNDIMNARVKNKYTKVRLVRRGGKHKYWTTETDYYIETDKNTIHDESDIWEGEWTDGDEYGAVEIGGTYDFKVNHDNVLGKDNAISVKSVSGADKPSW